MKYRVKWEERTGFWSVYKIESILGMFPSESYLGFVKVSKETSFEDIIKAYCAKDIILEGEYTCK